MLCLLNRGFLSPPFPFGGLFFIMAGLFHRLRIEPATFRRHVHRAFRQQARCLEQDTAARNHRQGTARIQRHSGLADGFRPAVTRFTINGSPRGLKLHISAGGQRDIAIRCQGTAVSLNTAVCRQSDALHALKTGQDIQLIPVVVIAAVRHAIAVGSQPDKSPCLEGRRFPGRNIRSL